MKPLLTIASLALALTVTGCAQFILPSASQINALGKDPSSIRLKVATIYGTMDLDRNMDRNLSATNSATVVITPETTLKVQPQ